MSTALKNPNVFCLESIWADDTNLPRQSVYPLLEIIKMAYNIKVSHLNCNTLEEFKHNLLLANRRYGVIYLAFHGRPGKLLVNENEITLDELAELMGTKFKRCGVHFASCSTLGITKSAIKDFIEKTGVSFVSGYTKNVYWIPSAAVDLIYLDYMISNFGNPEKAVELMKTQLVPSSKNLGFTFVS
jgi:hypothetical protein